MAKKRKKKEASEVIANAFWNLIKECRRGGLCDEEITFRIFDMTGRGILDMRGEDCLMDAVDLIVEPYPEEKLDRDELN